MKRLAIFASGTGSNTVKIAQFFRDNPGKNCHLIVTNNANAGILTNDAVADIEKWVVSNEEVRTPGFILKGMRDHQIDFIVLAGFLQKIPDDLVEAYPSRIVNIHPALLPKYGGKGMYGQHVHKAVYEAGESRSGITIHYVNAQYDEGQIIFQADTDVSECTSPDEVARKVLELEHYYYPRIINQILG